MGKAGKRAKSEKVEYLIEELLERRTYNHWNFGRIIQFKVKWLGYATPTWEPAWNIPEDIVREFESTHKSTPKALPLRHRTLMFKCSLPACAHIEIHPLQFMSCGGCLPEASVRYCSPACQLRDWPLHKHRCPAYARAGTQPGAQPASAITS